MDSEIIFEALTARSLTELKTRVRTAMKKQKEENNMLQQLQQQAEQLQQELQKAQQHMNAIKVQQLLVLL